MGKNVFQWGVIVVLGMMTFAAPARANGIVSHMHISDLALRRLPAGPLRDLLSDPDLVPIYRAGSVFPDSGYAADDAYGEICHWEPFTTAYVRWIRDRFGDDLSSDEARVHVAFLMGQASHGLADQIFDSLFMARTTAYDGTSDNLDVGAEAWLVVEHDPMNLIDGFVPASEMVDVFATHPALLEGHAPTVAAFERGRDQIVRGVRAVYAFGAFWYDMYWIEMPWAATHYYAADNVPGSLPHLAGFVTAYWQVLWARLRGTDTLAESLIGTWPEDGAVNFETRHERIESRAMMVLGHGIDRATLTPEHVRLLGPDGEAVASTARFIYGSPFANAVLVRPWADLDYDTEYTIELGEGIADIDGRTLPSVERFSFRTRCAPDRLEDCPPLPAEWERPENPTPPPRDAGTRPRVDAGVDAGDDDAGMDAGVVDAEPAGGCGCRTSGGAGASWFALAVVAGWRARSRWPRGPRRTIGTPKARSHQR
ncbi:MAG: Ig-like domain-containing protein [Myxococcales bacterium]|nr:Ig-like domain-containing protein [Myxococcales bacterium]